MSDTDDNEFRDYLLDKVAVQRHFSRAAKSYDDYAVLQAETAQRLFDRMGLIKRTPKKILDIGAGTGMLSLGLMQHYPQAMIHALDLAPGMCEVLRDKVIASKHDSNKLFSVVADAENLPYQSACFDLVVSSFTLQWCNEPDKVFAEVRRVLKPGGLFYVYHLWAGYPGRTAQLLASG